jgi:hypothetical protein
MHRSEVKVGAVAVDLGEDGLPSVAALGDLMHDAEDDDTSLTRHEHLRSLVEKCFCFVLKCQTN